MVSSAELPPNESGLLMNILRGKFMKPAIPSNPLDLSGRTAIITGGNRGIGLESARALLENKLHKLIITSRDAELGDTAVESLRSSYPSANIQAWSLDMFSYESMQSFITRSAELEQLDIVILNAGIGGKLKLEINASTGNEEIFQINYLSTALLALSMLPLLRDKRAKGQPGRLTIVGSNLDCAFTEQDYDPLLPAFSDPVLLEQSAIIQDRYGVTKVLLQFLLRKLEHLVSPQDVIVNVVNPGLVRTTGLDRPLPSGIRYLALLFRLTLGRSVQSGASTYLDAVAVKGLESHGNYLDNWSIAPFNRILYTAKGSEIGERLWNETLEALNFAGVKEIVSGMAHSNMS
ncbi:NAD(P)-binding protein [Thozetella sp. PMI_491]|nr:NAD(P)-binding protein [Thozetella sp. PMI_491]